MKITLAFLLLGISLALTNAGVARPKKMALTEFQGFSHSRMMSLMVKKWSDWQNCNKCRDDERACMERILVQDMCFVLKLFTFELKCSVLELFSKAKVKFQVQLIANACDHNEIEVLVVHLRSRGLINHFFETTCAVMNPHIKQANVEMFAVFQTVNTIYDGGLNVGLGCISNAFPNIFQGVVGAATGLASGATHAALGVASGLANAAGGIVNGATNAALGLAGGLGNTVGGVASGVTSGVNGLFGSLGGLTGGLKKG